MKKKKRICLSEMAGRRSLKTGTVILQSVAEVISFMDTSHCQKHNAPSISSQKGPVFGAMGPR